MAKESKSQSVLSSVRALLPEIAAAAEDVDRTGAVNAHVIARLHDAGYFALLQPPAFGGLDADPDDYLTATRELSSACMSTGWLAAWLGVNNWGLSVRDERVLQEIWGSDSRTLLCSSYSPTGRLERVDGGFWLTGRWSRCTGAHHASWLSVAALRVGPDGAAQDFMAVLVPQSDYDRRADLEWIGAAWYWRRRCRRHRCVGTGIPCVQLARLRTRYLRSCAAETSATHVVHAGRHHPVARCGATNARRAGRRIEWPAESNCPRSRGR